MRSLTSRPVQVDLRLDQLDSLRALAQKRKVSVSALVRQGVDRVLADMSPEEDPLWDMLGVAKSGPSDLAERHDEYLARLIRDKNR